MLIYRVAKRKQKSICIIGLQDKKEKEWCDRGIGRRFYDNLKWRRFTIVVVVTIMTPTNTKHEEKILTLIGKHYKGKEIERERERKKEIISS